MKALEKNIQDKVELSIVFYHDKHVEPFTLGATKYYPVNRYTSGKVSKIKQRILNSIEPDADVRTFVNIINQVKPDVIHIHGTETPYGLVQKFVDIPTVVSIQSIIIVYRYKYFSTISLNDIARHSNLKDTLFFRTFNNVYKRFGKMAAREQEIYNHTKHLIGRTAWDRRVASVLAPKAAYHHNDEILRPVFYQHQWHEPTGDKLMLFTTNGPDIYKGIETLLDCAYLLDNNNIDYEWQVAGLTAADETVKIAARTIGKPVSKSIRFLGSINDQDLAQALLKTHIYISTSHIENSPNSLCEAQILGMPCIATFAGGTNTLLKDNKDGLLIQDADPFAMAGAIKETRANYQKAIAMANHGRAKALIRHDADQITTDLLHIYETILRANT